MDSFCHSQLYKASPSQWRASVNLMRPINLLCLRWEWDILSLEMRGVQNLLCLRWERDHLSLEMRVVQNLPLSQMRVGPSFSWDERGTKPSLSQMRVGPSFSWDERDTKPSLSQMRVGNHLSLEMRGVTQESFSARRLPQPGVLLN